MLMSSFERGEYSFSMDEEEEHESGDEIKVISSQWKRWRIAVEQDMRDLRKRVSALERDGGDEFRFSKGSLITPGGRDRKHESFTTSTEPSCIRKCAHLIRSEKAAFLQCMWLIIMVITLSTFGILQFLRAHENVSSESKPEKKWQTVDYRDSKSDKQYEMPYIYLYFRCISQDESVNPDSNWSYEEINETLTYLLESLNFFNNSATITYINEEFNLMTKELPIVEAKASFEEALVYGYAFYGYFRLQPANPDPSLGSFQYRLYIDTGAFSRGLPLWVDGFWVSVNREMSIMNWEKTIYVSNGMAIKHGSKISATIDYDEKVLRTWRHGNINYFSSKLGWYYAEEYNNDSADWEAGMMDITFRGNLMIEHWEEYVSYSYYDWISGMGGMLSIASITFLWGAYYIAVVFGDKNTMGILPGISFVFSNLETIQDIKTRVPGEAIPM